MLMGPMHRTNMNPFSVFNINPYKSCFLNKSSCFLICFETFVHMNTFHVSNPTIVYYI